jgi:multisubunit Na+/H+ antiporter MnhE subunit
MRMARAAALTILALSMAIGPSLALDIKTDHDPTYDFTKVHTFYAKIGTAWGNSISEKNVLTTVENALIAKGWAKADEGSADAEVILHGSSQQKQDLQTFYSGYGGWGYGGWGAVGMGSATTTSYTYTEGTLLIDIFDAKAKELIFRGSATDTISGKQEKNQKTLNKALGKIFYDFPPAPAKPKK